MSFAMQALVAIHCDKHAGKWVAAELIARHLSVALAAVSRAGDQLVAQQALAYRQAEGREFFGVQVHADSEVLR